MCDAVRLWRRLKSAERTSGEAHTARASGARNTFYGDSFPIELAAMFRRVNQVANQLKIGAALEKVSVENIGNRFLFLVIDARVTV